MVRVAVAGGGSLRATDHHPFWDVTTRRWTDAINLRVGDQLREPDGTLTTVIGTRTYTASLTAYNLTVDTTHTYYVEAGGVPVLVHNSGVCELESGYIEPTELHHILPQQFRAYFARAGIDIDKATAELPQSVHQAAHDVGWNAEWKAFIDANPHATAAQITAQASKMMWEFGLDKYVIRVAPYR
jgi:hypothetical protein